MRRWLAICLLSGSLACSSVPQVPTCSITPDPVAVSDVYTVALTNGSPGTMVVLHLNAADGATTSKAIVIGSEGKATYRAIARLPGTTVVEVAPSEAADAPVLTTCVLHVSDSAGCGDRVCAATETCESCSDDCGACSATCGDGLCTAGETCSSCALDCGSCTSSCGDGTCNATETCQSCPADCGGCSASCGDKTCNAPTETCANCSTDCGPCAPVCGDGTCNGTETCSTCAQDCGTCPVSCGNGKCDTGSETCTNCPADCGACAPTCGDGQCNGSETCTTCAKDCGACAPKCGDLLCNGTETCTSCPGDCGACIACDPASSSLPNGKHKAGAACMSGCHSEFTIAGTAYTTVGGAAAVSGATITITDAASKKLTLVTASNGNFYSTQAVQFPLTVRGSKCPAVKPMNGQVTDSGGDCNGCHKAGNRIYIQ